MSTRLLKWWLLFPALLVALSLSVSSTAVTAQDDATATLEKGVVAEPSAELTASLADCTDVTALAPGESIETPEGATAFTIDSEQSEARYEAEEELVGIGANTAVGKTTAFIGQFFFDESGAPVSCSRFDVDLRTLESDESRRDNFLYRNTLEADTYPIATFVVRATEGFDAAVEDGGESTVYLIGDLTLHGVTQLVVWEATISREGDNLTGSASTEFAMADYNIQPPTVGPVMGISDPITLAVDFVATET